MWFGVGWLTFMLLQKAILGTKWSKDIPSTGLDLHTNTVKPWKYDDSIWLVDFPGGNATEDYAHQWKFFTALPSMAVLFLDFKDKLKAEQKEMYRYLKKDMKTKVLIAFNKVDERYTPRNQRLYVKEYFDQLKKETAKELKCDAKEIYYVSIEPDISDEAFQNLKKAGIYDFHQFLNEVIAYAKHS
jgi:signal recognition particle receptor subunit beta